MEEQTFVDMCESVPYWDMYCITSLLCSTGEELTSKQLITQAVKYAVVSLNLDVRENSTLIAYSLSVPC